MAEAALVMIPLIFFLMLAPGIWMIWSNEQHARTEAHRDMFDKTTTLMLIPEPVTSSRFNQITVQQRRHAYPAFPPSVDDLVPNPNNIMDPPDGMRLVVGPQVVDVFPDGFPNQYVEGWKYRDFRYRGGWFAGDMELMRYGAVIRPPWTWLGWPFIPAQDAFYEPRRIRAWYGDNELDDRVKDVLKLID
jgi:hypothetical protein